MRRLTLTAVLCAGLAACGGGSMSAQPPAPTPQATNFTAFTIGLLRSQPEDAQPAAVSEAQFVFSDNDNPQAFAAVVPAI